MYSPEKWLYNRIYCPSNRSKQIKETHIAYSAGTQYTRQSLNEKQHTWLHRQTVISCEAMYVIFHSNFAVFIVCQRYKPCGFPGFIWTNCWDNKSCYVITSPANSHGTWTQWSLHRVTHVTSTGMGSMTFASSFWGKGHCIHILWCIFVGLGHNDLWVELHMWPQQTWGQRSSWGQWPLVQVFEERVTVSTYCDVFLWDLRHNDPWVESHMWPQQTWGQRSSWGQWPLVQVFDKKGLCIHIL